MARHIMAVCVVCLLCADRIPCQEHLMNDYLVNGAQTSLEYQQLNARVYERQDALRFGYDPLTADSYNPSDDELATTNNLHNKPHRRRRHAGHAHDEETTSVMMQRPEITAEFLQRIFIEYGHKADGTLTVDEFQQILRKLGLNQLIVGSSAEQAEEQTSSHKHEFPAETEQAHSNDTCVTDAALVHHVQPHKLFARIHSHAEHNLNCSDTNASDCTHAHENQLKTHSTLHHTHSTNYTISKDDMLHLCPILLYQITSPLVADRTGCIDPAILEHVEEFEASQLDAQHQDIIYVWVYAFVSVFACGILGLVGVAIIPFMDSRYYKYIIQYFVALAVGTMTGDALLHLLPHSLAGQSEKNMILKGLACMSGIIFFYMTEHGLTMISEWRKRIAKNDTKQQSRAKVVRDPESSVNNSFAGDKVCKSKYSSYPYCYDEIAMDTKNDMHLPGSKLNNISDLSADLMGVSNNSVEQHKRNGKSDADANDGVAQSLIPTVWHHNHQDHHTQHQQSQQQQQHNANLPDSNTISTDLDGNSMGGAGDGHSHALVYNPTVTTNGNTKEHSLVSESVPTVILREHESSHHGHSHKHGHVHSPPESLSAVVWMIIMGDGLHNFTDGMAIGAAFAENFAGGFSTSLAVFCHELPHEVGDFAILIKAGMSVKSAVYYNLLTSVLSFIGMIFGIVFGQTPNVAQWMFAVAAGLFIYIALVDMMPELSSAHKTVEQFLLQIFGMCTGVGIMLLIALYEGELLSIFSSSSSATTASVAHHQH